jgi:glucose-1-phosphate thymidylyltransferase
VICIVLAAGYATRLYPLTENFPKPLLPVQGKTILDWLLEDVDAIPEITGHVIVSNHRFIRHFETWKSTCGLTKPVIVLDDGSTSNGDRLGAVVDIGFAMNALQRKDDVLVLAGDNIVDFSFRHFLHFAAEKRSSCVMYYEEPVLANLRSCGVLMLDEYGRILSMVEKPANPPSSLAVPPFYCYLKDDIALLDEAIRSGCGTDAPGSLVAWMCQNRTMHAWEMKVGGQAVHRFDIGTLEGYRRIEREFQGNPEIKANRKSQGNPEI